MAYKDLQLCIQDLSRIDRSKSIYSECGTNIVGLLATEGQGGFAYADGIDIQMLIFEPWQIVDGPVISSELTLLRPVDSESNYFQEFQNRKPYKVSVLLSDNQRRAIVLNDLTLVDETSCPFVFDQPNKTVDTSRFGNLEYSRRNGVCTGQAVWMNGSISLRLIVANENQLADCINVASQVFDKQRVFDRKAKEASVMKLLDIKNNDWREENERILTKSAFLKRICVTAINCYPTGQFEMYFHDDGMFAGHIISACGSVDGTISTVRLCG